MSTWKTTNFFGITFTTTNAEGFREKVIDWGSDSKSGFRMISYINPHVYNIHQKFPEVGECLTRSDWVCVDGIGIKLTALPFIKLPRVNANTVFDKLVNSVSINTKAILIGNTPEVVAAARAKMNENPSGITISKDIDGFRSDAEYQEILKEHEDIPLILIGMGSPRSEQLMLQMSKYCPNALVWYIGGGTIKVYAGTKLVTPAWISYIGLEWIYRGIREPALRHRYSIGVLQFFINVLKNFRS